MRRALVTGTAGFIGSTLSDRLLADGWSVRGVDCFTAYYDQTTKRANVQRSCTHHNFELIDTDLRTGELVPLLDDVDVVFHLAGQPGVRKSWADGFDEYNAHNVGVTQRLLEAVRVHEVDRFVYASSSSVYGDSDETISCETSPTVPVSPYGVTKLAAELMCRAYAVNFGIPTVALRYFTVYGPRQRPDMAIHRLIESSRSGTLFPLYGDGSQVRDFTFVDDVVDATVRASTKAVAPGSVFNVAGGASTSLIELIEMVQTEAGANVILDQRGEAAGDVRRTAASTTAASNQLGWKPTVDLASGVARQVRWQLGDRT